MQSKSQYVYRQVISHAADRITTIAELTTAVQSVAKIQSRVLHSFMINVLL